MVFDLLIVENDDALRSVVEQIKAIDPDLDVIVPTGRPDVLNLPLPPRGVAVHVR